MLTTPLGKIKIYADGNCVCYKAVEHNFRQPPCKDRPVAGCYRIEISCRGISTVSCVLEPLDTVHISDSSGEKYAAIEFVKNQTILTIGTEDDNPAFEVLLKEYGLQYILLQSMDKVVFGLAWATDYEGIEDVRTWYAADPTLS